ncbi:PREDICTED: calcium-binding protein CML38-like [Camelina sativa]|uniref:Calcium-binding protein CML38-like n=1 Tax=Camelina sativa TaxID=90675 RepID=A0ABM0TMZ8_CAMSA|nr:PREDICTED: calcium-binding protein CML38-like [Camelina sativa]
MKNNNNTPRQSSFKKFCRKLSPERKDSSREIQQHSSSNVDDKNRDLEAVFAYLDANRDGRISAEELQKSFTTLGEQLSDEEAEAAVKLSDTDGDGMLDFEEFAQLIKRDDDVFTEEEKKMELKEAFRLYISEGEECITPRSLKLMLKKLGESRTTDDCKVMISAFDLNADGVLSFDEFALMMR